MGFDYGLSLTDISWADAYDNEVPEGTVIAANANDCEDIIVVISLGPHPTQTAQSEEIPDCGEDEYEGWTGECCPTDGSNSNCGVSPCHKIGGSPDYEYDENGECVKKEPLPDHQEISGFQDINACKLTIQSQEALSLAYDRPTDRLNPTGLVETVVLFADFADVSATQTTEEVFSYISPGAEDFFFDQSYGRLSLSFVPHHKWLRLSSPAAIYREALTSYTGHRDWIQEAMNLADDNVDFSNADAVLVVSPPNATEIPYGPTLMGWSTPNDGSLTADGTYIANAVTSGADLTYWGDLWYPHEMGHSLGLPDLYGATIPGREGFTRPFSLMDDIGSTAPGYMGYSRWILKWLDDSQIACIDGNATITLTPVATPGGLKVALFPFTQSRALAIESRRQIGYDTALEREGAVVYIVNTENGFGGGSGEGPMEVLNNAQALLPNESVTYENVTVTVKEASSEGDVIQIDIND
tara:strand:- start:566 stop:1972 length:1407 start_codon:yes stop_codon:yes gene_type:complete